MKKVAWNEQLTIENYLVINDVAESVPPVTLVRKQTINGNQITCRDQWRDISIL